MDEQTTKAAESQTDEQMPSARKVFLYFLLLGFVNIGGPVAQITMMYNHMVEKEHWLSKDRFVKIMGFAHMLPGPEALQLAIYVGYLKRGLLGGTIAGLTFIIPGAIVMVVLSFLYVTYGSLPQVNDVLFILKPAVLGIIGAGIIKLGRAAIQNALLAVLLAGAVLSMVFARIDFLIVLLLAGLLNLLFTQGVPRLRRAPGVIPALLAGMGGGLLAATNVDWLQMAWLFLKTGLFSFGGAYASLVFLQRGAVDEFHWLTATQLLDGVALSVATPGPFMLFTTFAGYLAGGIPGAFIATFFVFLPSFVFVIAGARYIEQVRNNRFVQAFLAGASAAVVGVILVVSLELVPGALSGTPSIPVAGVPIGIPNIIITLVAFLAITWRKVDVALVAVAAMAMGILYAVVHSIHPG
jgi:chromate transporter